MTGGIGGARARQRSARAQDACLDCSDLRRRKAAALAGALVVAVAGVLAIAGCGPAAAPPPPDRRTGAEQAAPVSSMFGLLMDAHGTPVGGAIIEVRAAGEVEILANDISDAEGSFDFDVVPGVYDVRVIPRDGSPPQIFPGQLIGLNGGGTLELMLVAIASETTVVSLRIVDRRGSPVPGSVCSHDDCAPIGVDGWVHLTVRAGFPPELSLSSQVGRSSFGFKFLVEPRTAVGGTLPDLVVPLLEVNAQVVDASGDPVTASIRPACYAVDYPGLTGISCSPATSTGADGRLQFAALPGAMQLFVDGPHGTFQTIDVSDDADVTVRLPPPHPLSGQITDRAGNPVAGLSICLSHVDQGAKAGPICIATDGSGRYQTDLSEGAYDMELFTGPDLTISTQLTLNAARELNIVFPTRRLTGQLVDGSGNPEAGVSVSAGCYPIAFDGFTGRLCPGSQSADQSGRFQFDLIAGPVPLTAHDATGSAGLIVAVADDIDVQLQVTTVPGLIMGRVVDQNGQGIGGRSVCYNGDPGASIGGCSLTDATGAYQMFLLPGNYQVFASTTDDNGITHADHYGITTLPPAPATLSGFTTRPLSVRLVGGDGAPITGASVKLAADSLPLPKGDEFVVDFNARFTDGGGAAQLGAIPDVPLTLNIELPGTALTGGFLVQGAAPDDLQAITIALQPR